MGYAYDPDPRVRPERHHVVVSLTTTFRHPVQRPGPLTIELEVERLGRTSLALGFQVCATTGDLVYADGVRTGVRVDPAGHSPVPWSHEFRENLYAEMT
jgi:acyl-CoA thioester hydrolase